MALTICGSQTGAPVVYFHGCPGSGLEVRFLENAALKHGIRLIAPNRPGIGLSDINPTPMDDSWSRDMLELVDLLELSSFGIMAFSGGTAYALRFAELASSRVFGVGLVSPFFVPVLPRRLSLRVGAVAFRAAIFRYFTFLLYPSMLIISRHVRHHGQSYGDILMKGLEESDLAHLQIDENRCFFLASVSDAYANGPLVIIRDLQQIGRTFQPSLPINIFPIRVWHDVQDKRVPDLLIERCQALLPGVLIKQIPNGGHFLIAQVQDDICAFFKESSAHR